MLPYASLAVENQNSILHFLDDVLADDGLVAKFFTTPTRQFFVGNDTIGQQARGDRDREKACAEQAGLKKVDNAQSFIQGA